MGTVAAPTEIDRNLKAVIQNLYNLLVETLEHQPDSGKEVMKKEIRTLDANLQTLHRTASTIDIEIPPDVVKFVEEGRNPDIHQRQFVEEVQKFNQRLKGRTEAYTAFQEILGRELVGAVPELRGQVKRTVEHTGGTFEG